MEYDKSPDKICSKRKREEERNYLSQPGVVISAQASSVRKNKVESWGPDLAWRGCSKREVGFFSSQMEVKPWFKMQIKPVEMSRVTIINRKDGYGERLKNLEVRAGMSPDLDDKVVGTFKGPGVTGAEHVIRFNRTIMVEFIIFQMMERGILQINGIKIPFYLDPGALYNPVSTSLPVFLVSEYDNDAFHRKRKKITESNPPDPVPSNQVYTLVQSDVVDQKSGVCQCGQCHPDKCPYKMCGLCCDDISCKSHKRKQSKETTFSPNSWDGFY